jgi:flagellar motor switch protein FliG
MAKKSGPQGDKGVGASGQGEAKPHHGLIQRGKETATYLLNIGEQVASTVIDTLKAKTPKAKKAKAKKAKTPKASKAKAKK